MIGTYQDAVNWIHSRLKFGIKPGMERILWMLGQLGHPHQKMKCVHIAGTNGKGSTVTLMRFVLQEANYKVGTFTSPYIESFNERISVNGEPISDEEIVELVNVVHPVVEQMNETELGPATEFEIITLMAFYYFGVKNICDIVLIETGLGGSLDSTNVVNPVLTIITTIGHDHMNILGETLPQIAKEKAGIIKAGVPVVTGVLQPEAVEVIQVEAKDKRVKVYQLGQDFSVYHQSAEARGEFFSFISPFHTLENAFISLRGSHQVHNAALALMGVYFLKTYQSFQIEEDKIRRGLHDAFWPGRFELLFSSPDIIIDGAHNPEGIDTLLQTIQTHYKGKRIIILFSALQDKRIDEMVEKLRTTADQIIFTTFEFPRAVPARLLAEHSKLKEKLVYEDWRYAIDRIRGELSEDDVLVVTGSLYFISQVRKYITGNVSK